MPLITPNEWKPQVSHLKVSKCFSSAFHISPACICGFAMTWHCPYCTQDQGDCEERTCNKGRRPRTGMHFLWATIGHPARDVPSYKQTLVKNNIKQVRINEQGGSMLKIIHQEVHSSISCFLRVLKDQGTVPSESLCKPASILQTHVPPPLLLWQFSLIYHFAREVPQKTSKKGRCTGCIVYNYTILYVYHI